MLQSLQQAHPGRFAVGFFFNALKLVKIKKIVYIYRYIFLEMKMKTTKPSIDNPWQPLFDSLTKFSEDFLETRNQPQQQDRKDLFS